MEKIDKETKEGAQKTKTAISLPNAIVVAGVIIALALVFSSTNKNFVSSEGSSSESGLAIPEVTEEDFIMGPANAEITLIEYSDFSCSFCARYHPTMKRVIEEYKGEVRWVYRHLPIFNKPAAVASQCVGNILGDEKFFLYADKLFENQQDINSELLKREALSLGVSDSDYDSCINNKEINDKISREFTSVRVLAGFNATPYTVIVDRAGNMYPFSGALPYEEVSALIDTVLKKL